MYRVAYTNQIDPRDWARVTPSIVKLHGPLSWRDPDGFSEKLSKSDLAILHADPYANVEMIRAISHEKSHGLLRNSLLRACWSEDSHHVWHMEAELLPLFHHMFVAHSEYLSVFPDHKTHWLPTSFNSLSLEELIRKTASPKGEFERDIIFPFRRYPDALTNRNQLANEIEEICKLQNVSTLIGEVGSGTADQQGTTCREILNSFGVLNVSLREELNQRVFIAHALNKPLLCDSVVDLQNVDLDLSATICFDRDLSDFTDKLDEFRAISSEQVSTRGHVLRNHMHLHRLVEMINTCLNLDLKIQIPELDFCDKPISEVRHGIAETVPYPPFTHSEIKQENLHSGLYGLYRAIRTKMKQSRARRADIYHPQNIRNSVKQFLRRAG